MASASSPTAAYNAQNGVVAKGSYDPQVVDWVRQAAAATGADPVALLATSLQESGAQRGRVGDQGTSFGPFQHHVNGALGSHPPAWANTYPAVLERAQQFKRYGVRGGTGAAAVQKPLDQTLYARGVDGLMARAAAILGDPSSTPTEKKKAVATLSPGAAATPAAVNGDHADVGAMILQSFIDANAHVAKLPGSSSLPSLPAGASMAQRMLGENAALAGIPATPFLPQEVPAPSSGRTTPAPARGTSPPRPDITPTPTGVNLAPGGGWGGSHAPAQRLAKLGQSFGLSISSEKRDRQMTASGNQSDHWTGSKNAYAYDLSNGSKPTPQMDQAATAIAAQLGVKGWKGGVLNVNRGGFRFQVLYRTNVGGNHFNHVHVGVRKL